MARPRKRPETELSKFLDDKLRRRQLSHTEFSRKVGLKPASFSDLKLRDETAAPGRDVASRWAEVLGLSPAEERELFDKLQLAHAPRYVQDLIREYRSEIGIRVAASTTAYRPEKPGK